MNNTNFLHYLYIFHLFILENICKIGKNHNIEFNRSFWIFNISKLWIL